MNLEQALAVLRLIDECTPLADETCKEPGITISEAAKRQLIDEGHPAFSDPNRRCPHTIEMFP